MANNFPLAAFPTNKAGECTIIRRCVLQMMAVCLSNLCALVLNNGSFLAKSKRNGRRVGEVGGEGNGDRKHKKFKAFTFRDIRTRLKDILGPWSPSRAQWANQEREGP